MSDFWLEIPVDSGTGTVANLTGFDNSVIELLTAGPQGPQGDTISPFLVYGFGVYPPRVGPEIPAVFVGPVNPESLGLMLIGDVWMDTNPDSGDEPEYVTIAGLAQAVDNALGGVTAQITDINDRLDDLEQIPGPPGLTLLAAEFPTPASGDTSQLFYLPEGTSEIKPPFIQCDTAPIGSSVTVVLEADQGSGFTSILPSNIAITPGTNYFTGTAPTTQALADNSKLRWKVISAPVTTLSNLARNANIGTTNSTTNAISNINLAKPVGAVTGDLLVAFIARQNQTLTYSSDWQPITEVVTDVTTPQARLTVLGAINSPTLTMSVGLSSGTPALSTVLSFSGFNTNGWNSSPVTFGANNGGNTVTFGSYSVGDDDAVTTEPRERVIYCALSRHGAADETRVHNWTGTGLTAITDLDTSRGSSNTDLHMSLQEKTATQTDGTTITGITVGNVAGSAFVSWCEVILGIREGISAGSASRLNCQVMVRS